jgi:hypothetical protein
MQRGNGLKAVVSDQSGQWLVTGSYHGGHGGHRGHRGSGQWISGQWLKVYRKDRAVSTPAPTTNH